MSQPRGSDPEKRPLPHDGSGSEPHPDEAMAAYVDGSASPAEVQLARTHLTGCARCREDVEIARRSVRVLKELPELEPPWVEVEPDVLPRRAVGAHQVRTLDRRRGRARTTTVIAAVGLAAAASVAVVVLLVHPGGSSSGSAASPALGARAGAPNVTAADLGGLTIRLAGARVLATKDGTAPEAGGSSSVGFGAAQPRLPANPTIAPDAVAGVPCARRASGQSDSAVVVYAQQAMFQGKRVWVVGFVTTPTSGGTPRVEVVAATTEGCRVVYVGRSPLSSSP